MFLGTEAIVSGQLTEHELRRWHRCVYPDVYVPKSADLSLRDRAWAAWLWSKRRAVVAGIAAAALHGSNWIDANEPIELIAPSARRHQGLIVRNQTLADREVASVGGVPVTTPARTAFDLGRHLPATTVIARLDALMRATSFSVDHVTQLALRHPGARGVRQLRAVLPLVDGGAASPKETWLRILLVEAGFPSPTTQIPVADGWRLLAVLDRGWEVIKVAAEYDGDHHRSVRAPDDILRQVREAFRRRTSSRSTVA